MAKRLLLRDAESLSQDMLQRLLGVEFWNTPATPGVGTGYAAGLLGKVLTTSTGHLAVTANGTTMVLTILPGWAAVVRDAGGSTFDPRALFAESDANDSSITITANATGSTRNDTVCLKIDMATAPTSDGSNLVTFVAIAGAAGGGLSNAPADGNLYLPLANVAVANGATSLAQGNVTDLRSSFPAASGPGGTLAGGNLQVIADQGTFTALTDLTGLAATVMVGAGRRIRITAFASAASTVANDSCGLQIREGATTLQEAQFFLGTTATGVIGQTASVVLQPAMGSHTYKVSMRRVVGTGNITMKANAAMVAYILVEDIGV
jgi:hypothetical protein